MHDTVTFTTTRVRLTASAGGVHAGRAQVPKRSRLSLTLLLCAAGHPQFVRVLVAEDERRLADAIARGLRREGMAVDVAPDGSEALVKARLVRYDVLVLDRDLPGVHGDDVCRTLRTERPETGILMLTAAGSLEDLVSGLSLGADDYLAKPFRFAELVARIHALGRRAAPSRPPVLHHGNIELDPARRELSRDGHKIDLARKEFAVLEALMAADGATVSAEELLERVWDEQIDPFTNVVRMTIMTLRRKLGDPPAIETVIGVGYRMA
jgi:DNA-binding response OmpR family regulator